VRPFSRWPMKDSVVCVSSGQLDGLAQNIVDPYKGPTSCKLICMEVMVPKTQGLKADITASL
jgi:hypothetical protein